MRDYRAYVIGDSGLPFIRAEFLSEHPDDASAMEAAKLLVDGHDVELWDSGRLVARLSPDGEACSPELAPSAIDEQVLPALKMAFGALF
jgi:cobalamin biosynthesis protein CbiG